MSGPGRPASGSDDDPVERFAARLRALREEAGSPSFRTLARRSGCISHTTLHEATQGNRMPSWETTEQFVLACRGEPETWRGIWEDTSAALALPEDDADTAPSAAAPAAGDDAHPTTAEDARPPTGDQETPVGDGAGPAPGDDGPGPIPADGAADPSSVGDRPPSSTDADRPAPSSAEDVGVSTPTGLHPASGQHRSPRRLLALCAAALLLGTALGLGGGYLLPGRPTPAPAATPSGTSGPQPGDAIDPPEELNLPDGSVVQPGTTVTKSWRLTNAGDVTWRGRVLRRMTLPDTAGAMCGTPETIAVPETPPGGSVQVDVPVTVPDTPGETCRVEWKMTTADGAPSFPDGRPLFFYLRIVG